MKKTKNFFIFNIIFTLVLGVALFTIPQSVGATFNHGNDNNFRLSCASNGTNFETGETVTWSAVVTGGVGDYTYHWSGTDNLSGSSASISKSYSSRGTKNVSVTVTSGSRSISRSCTIFVEEEEEPIDNLVGSCSVTPSHPEIGDTVTWNASASGGVGNFSYNWSGTNGLSGSSASKSKSYSSSGTKNASVVITSGSQSITRNCSVFVEEEEEDMDDLVVSCAPDGQTFEVGERFTWRAQASGGDGDYTYDWSGTGGLDADSRTASVRYGSEGTKRASVTVRSDDGQRETATCRVFIEEDDDDNDDDDLDIACRVSDTRIEEGDRVTFEADIEGGNSPYDIEWDGDIDDIDNFDDNDRRQTVRIDERGRYEIEVEVRDDDGRRAHDTCRTVVVDGDDNDTDFTITSTTGGGRVAGVSLSQVPYTGLTDSPVLNVILYALAGLTLMIIGSISLFILRKRDVVSVPAGGHVKGDNTFVVDYTDKELTLSLEDSARKNKVIVSTEAMETIILRSKQNKVGALILLNKVIKESKKNISTDAWLVLSKQKISDIL